MNGWKKIKDSIHTVNNMIYLRGDGDKAQNQDSNKAYVGPGTKMMDECCLRTAIFSEWGIE